MNPASDIPAVNQINPLHSFKSILRVAPLPTPEKVAIAARVLRGELLRDVARRLGVTPQHLSRAINASGNQGLVTRKRVANLLGLDLEDISSPGEPRNHGSSITQSARQINGI